MRSRIGTKSRLAAHLTALALLIVLLTQVDPQPDSGSGVFSPIPVPAVPVVQEPAEAVAAAPASAGTVRPVPKPDTTRPSSTESTIPAVPLDPKPISAVTEEDPNPGEPAKPLGGDGVSASTQPVFTVPPETTLSTPDEPELAEPVESGSLRPPSGNMVLSPPEKSESGQPAQPSISPASGGDDVNQSETAVPPVPAVQPPQPVEPVAAVVDGIVQEAGKPSPVIPIESIASAETNDKDDSSPAPAFPESTIHPLPSIPEPDMEAELVSPDEEMDLLGALPETEAVIDAVLLSAEPVPSVMEEAPDQTTRVSSLAEPAGAGQKEAVDREEAQGARPVAGAGGTTDPVAATAMVIPDEVKEYLPEQTDPPGEDRAESVTAPPVTHEDPENPIGGDSESPATAQPDESGSLVVAEPEPDANGVPVLAPLPNHPNLEVLGDGVYWLSSRHDFDKELEAIPETSAIVVLTPLPEFSPHYPGYKQVVAIPADTADISRDSADHFLFLTGQASPAAPVVVAALANARGAAFYKGLYLLRHRDMPYDTMVAAIQPELEEAGPAKNEILHRLFRSLQE